MKRILSGLLIAACLGVGGPALAQDLNQRAAAARDAQRWPEAEKLYTALIEKSPKQADYYLNRGLARRRKSDFLEAIVDDTRAEVLYWLNGSSARERAEVLVHRGYAYIGRGEWFRALIEALAACAMDETDAKAWELQAMAMYDVGQYSKAMACLARAKELDKTITAYYTPEGAELNGKALGSISPVDIDGEYQNGMQSQAAGRYDAAILAFSRVLTTSPTVIGAWVNRGNTYCSLKDYDKAIADFSAAVSLQLTMTKDKEKQAGILACRANAYRVSGRLELARLDCELALKLDPGNEYARRALYDIGLDKGHGTSSPLDQATRLLRDADKESGTKSLLAARELLDKLLQGNPKDVQALLLRARAEQVRGKLHKPEAALPFYDRAIAAAPGNKEAYLRRGLLINQLPGQSAARKAQAVADLKKAISLGAGDAETHYQLAMAFGGVDDSKGAIEALEVAVKKAPNKAIQGLYLRDLAVLQAIRQDWPVAIKNLTTLIALEPREADHLVERGRCRRLSGDKAGALLDYRAARVLNPRIPAIKEDLSNAEEVERGHVRAG